MSTSHDLEVAPSAALSLSPRPESSNDVPPASPRYTKDDITYALQQLRGHLNNLTSQQAEALDEFKKRLTEAGLFSPDATPDGPDDDGEGRLGQDDVTLLCVFPPIC